MYACASNKFGVMHGLYACIHAGKMVYDDWEGHAVPRTSRIELHAALVTQEFAHVEPARVGGELLVLHLVACVCFCAAMSGIYSFFCVFFLNSWCVCCGGKDGCVSCLHL